jgi:CHC2 zinc finger
MNLIDIGQFKADLGMIDVLRVIGWRENFRAGSQLRGPCPFHGSSPKSRSFSVSITRKCYRCFKRDCGVMGGHLDLYIAHANITNAYVACLELSKLTGIPLTYLESREVRS